MTRLEQWRKNVKIEYPDDISKMRSLIPELSDIPDAQIQDMYSWWSENYFCAGWLIFSEGTAKEFQKWLIEEITEPEILW